MTSITDALTSRPTAQEAANTPTATFDGCSGKIETRRYTEPINLHDSDAIDQIITDAGLDPATVMCVSHPRVSTWDVPNHGRQWAYKLELAPRSKTRPDVKALLADITTPTPAHTKTGKHWATVQIGDVHIGKSAEAGGGTESILARYRQSIANALEQLELLDPLGIEGVHLAFVGDMIEGIASQGGKNIALMDLSLTEQIHAATRLTVQTIKAFCAAGYQVRMSAIGGNHGDTQRVQGGPAGDNHDIGIALAAADWIEDGEYRDLFEHVVPPRDQSYMTFPVGDTVFTSVHGHQFSGSGAHGKVERWWSGQALSNTAAASGQVLMAGHFHTFAHLNIAEGRTAIYSPSMEHMSRWFHDKTGATSDRGACFYLTSGGAISHLTII